MRAAFKLSCPDAFDCVAGSLFVSFSVSLDALLAEPYVLGTVLPTTARCTAFQDLQTHDLNP